MTSQGQQVYRLRDVDEHDFTLTNKWANDSLAREMSFSQWGISEEEHRRWFPERVKEGRWWILEKFGNYKGDEPIGQIRFDRRILCLNGLRLSECFIVSIFIDEKFRGLGWANALLRMGLGRIDLEFHNEAPSIIAHIKPANDASLRLFGHFMSKSEKLSGPTHHTYVRF